MGSALVCAASISPDKAWSMISGAIFSEERPAPLYRYALWRGWGDGPTPTRPFAMFVGLNPSTADETHDDPTIRRCVRFARDWGYSGLVMANLFAWRSTEPRGLLATSDPVGPVNDAWLQRIAAEAGIVVAAWGVGGHLGGRAQQVIDSGVLGAFRVLGTTKAGQPRHPLYMPASTRPMEMAA